MWATMTKTLDDKTKAKLITQVTCVLALVALAAIDAFSVDFAVNVFVYAIIAGILFGVGGVRELVGGVREITKEIPKEADHEK